MSVSLLLLSLFVLFNLPYFRQTRGLSTVRDRAAVAAGLFFLFTGAMHFVRPEMYDRMMPPFLPWPRLLALTAGGFELLGGLGLLLPRYRRAAGMGLVALLFAVMPANIHVAVQGIRLEELPFGPWYFWLRIPFQLFYIGWVWWAARVGRASLARPEPPARVRA
jgi:uncharacterized membrane protein